MQCVLCSVHVAVCSVVCIVQCALCMVGSVHSLCTVCIVKGAAYGVHFSLCRMQYIEYTEYSLCAVDWIGQEEPTSEHYSIRCSANKFDKHNISEQRLPRNSGNKFTLAIRLS